MAEMLINGQRAIKGKLTVTRSLDMSQNPPVLTIVGELVTHRYFEEINTIETERLNVEGVTVLQEVFGSEDNCISYAFIATAINLDGGESNLPDNKVDELENKLFGGE